MGLRVDGTVGASSSDGLEDSSTILRGLGVSSSSTRSAGVGLGDFLREPWKVDL